jgi:hypothetical protein
VGQQRALGLLPRESWCHARCTRRTFPIATSQKKSKPLHVIMSCYHSYMYMYSIWINSPRGRSVDCCIFIFSGSRVEATCTVSLHVGNEYAIQRMKDVRV